MKQTFLLGETPKSLDEYVIRRKAWQYLTAKGERVDSPLINLHRPGLLSLAD